MSTPHHDFIADMLRARAVRTLVMGVVNVTPDSFSDGSRFYDKSAAISHAFRLRDEGADILDIGGESTAPNSPPVDAEEECRRVLPVVEACAARGLFVSVDTYKAEVARRALEAGAAMINDVTALRGDPALAAVLAGAKCPMVLMHAKDPTPRTTPTQRTYTDVVAEISAFLASRVEYAAREGIAKERIVLDPGMGAFVSADPEPSLEILCRLNEFHALGRPLLLGASRKGFIGKVLGLPVTERLEGSLACAAVGAWHGVRIIRAHEVLPTVRVVRMVDAIRCQSFQSMPPCGGDPAGIR